MEYGILAIDPAKSTGWVYVLVSEVCFENNVGFYKMKDDMYINIIEYGIIEVDTNTTEGQYICKYKENIKTLIDRFNIDSIVVENYFFSMKARQGALVNVYLRSMIYLLCEELGKPYEIVSVYDWKRHICGTVKPSVEFIKKHGKQNSNKTMVKVALSEKYNINFPEKMTNPTTNKKVKFRYDIIDAVAICIYRIETLSK